MTPSDPRDTMAALELSTGIAASYCGKLFADAGADVVKLEPPLGDPLRRWTASGQRFWMARTALCSTSSTPGSAPSWASCATRPAWRWRSARTSSSWTRRVTDPRWPQRAARPDSPHDNRLDHAVSGSPARIPSRECEPPSSFCKPSADPSPAEGCRRSLRLQAGGRIGEWISGCYGAVAAAAPCTAPRQRTRHAGGPVDVRIDGDDDGRPERGGRRRAWTAPRHPRSKYRAPVDRADGGRVSSGSARSPPSSSATSSR